MSYFIYDTISMYIEGSLDLAMSLHHPLSITGYLVPLYENFQGNYSMLAVLNSEMSHPSMSARHILRLTGRRYTRAYEIAELLFLGIYSYARAVNIIPVVIGNLTCDVNHLFYKIACLGLTVQSFFFIS